MENEIYASLIGTCEKLEADGIYKGNGHHLAQKLSWMVREGLLSKQEKLVYAQLTNVLKTTKEISLGCELPSKNVSTILDKMSKETTLIVFIRKGKLKSWKRRYNEN